MVLLPPGEAHLIPGEKQMGLFANWQEASGVPFDASVPGFMTQTNTFHAHYVFKDNDLKLETNYALSFKIKGTAYRDAKWTVAYFGRTRADVKESAVGGRGAVQRTYKNLINGHGDGDGNLFACRRVDQCFKDFSGFISRKGNSTMPTSLRRSRRCSTFISPSNRMPARSTLTMSS